MPVFAETPRKTAKEWRSQIARQVFHSVSASTMPSGREQLQELLYKADVVDVKSEEKESLLPLKTLKQI